MRVKKRVVVAVKDKQRFMEAGEEMRVAYGLDEGGVGGDSGEGCMQ